MIWYHTRLVLKLNVVRLLGTCNANDTVLSDTVNSVTTFHHG
jgi:hypothetical protein